MSLARQPFSPPLRLAYLVSHPIQYQAPLLRRIAAEPDIELMVFFCSDASARGYHDKGFDRVVQWDVPLLEGYAHAFLPAWGKRQPITELRPFTHGVAAALKRGRYEALWVHSYARLPNLAAMASARRLGIPVLLREEASAISQQRGAAKRRLKSAFMAGLDRLVTAYLAIGSANAAYYRAHGVAEARIFPMPYAVDNDRFRAMADAARPQRAALRASLGISDRRPVVLMAARLIPEKAARDLIAAWPAAMARLPGERQAELVVVGDGPLRAEIAAASAAHPAIKLAGFRNQTELPAFYAMADLLVLPSHREPWGLVVNEAMNASCAILASDRVGAALDLVQPGVNGEIFPAGSIPALADALARLLRDPDRLAQMGRASRDIIAGWSFAEDVAGLRAALHAVAGR